MLSLKTFLLYVDHKHRKLTKEIRFFKVFIVDICLAVCAHSEVFIFQKITFELVFSILGFCTSKSL